MYIMGCLEGKDEMFEINICRYLHGRKFSANFFYLLNYLKLIILRIFNIVEYLENGENQRETTTYVL